MAAPGAGGGELQGSLGEPPGDPLRVGRVRFLNTLPLFGPIELGLAPFSGVLLNGSPAALAEAILRNEVDVAPIPIVTWARHPERLVPLSGLCIAADGPVRSVLLFSKGAPHPQAVVRVAVPTDSLTSILLLRLLAPRIWGPGTRVELRPMEPMLRPMLREAAAGLLIGDAALLAAAANPELHQVDLGALWKEVSGTPMVFALMVARAELRDDPRLWQLHAELKESLRIGLQRLELFAARASAMDLHLSTAQALTYFQGLRFALGEREIAGAETFLREVQTLGGLATTTLRPLDGPVSADRSILTGGA